MENQWIVVNFVIDQSDDFYISGKQHTGACGLHELLFMKHSEDYDQHDLTEYKSILIMTNIITARARTHTTLKEVCYEVKQYKELLLLLLKHFIYKKIHEYTNKNHIHV